MFVLSRFRVFWSNAAQLKRDLTFQTALWIYKAIRGIWKLRFCTKHPQLASYAGPLYPQTAHFHVSSQARCTLIKDCVSAYSKLPSFQNAFMSCLHLERALEYSEHLRKPIECLHASTTKKSFLHWVSPSSEGQPLIYPSHSLNPQKCCSLWKITGYLLQIQSCFFAAQ